MRRGRMRCDQCTVNIVLIVRHMVVVNVNFDVGVDLELYVVSASLLYSETHRAQHSVG